VQALAAEPEQRSFLLGWSRWRRAHQARANRCHSGRRLRERAVRLTQSVVAPTRCKEVSDRAWARIQPLLPPQRPVVGRPRHDHRTILSGIFWVLRTASPWRELPAEFGKWDTAYARYRLWRAQGRWQRLIDALGPEAPVTPPLRTGGTTGKVSL
jgi:transposase